MSFKLKGKLYRIAYLGTGYSDAHGEYEKKAVIIERDDNGQLLALEYNGSEQVVAINPQTKIEVEFDIATREWVKDDMTTLYFTAVKLISVHETN